MLRIIASFFFLLISLPGVAQSVTTPTFVTDPTKLESKNVADMQTFSIDKLYTTRTIGDSTWSPDGKQIAFVTNISGRNNIWVVPASGGWPTQLTISEQRQTTPAWSPDGTWIAYASDQNGDEQWDIFLVSPKNGDVVNLTVSKDISEEEPTWSPNGRQIAYIVKPKTGSNYEIDLMDVATRHVRHLTQNTPKTLSNFGMIFSHDGKTLFYSQTDPSFKDSNIFQLELDTGKSTKLTSHSGEQTYVANDVSPDGKTLLITSNARDGYDNIGLFDVASQKITWLTGEKWEMNAGSFSPDGKSVTWTANVDGNTGIFLYDIENKKTFALPLPKGVNELAGDRVAFSRGGASLMYYHNGPNAPQDLWVYDVASQQSRQVTHSLVGGVRAADMVEPYLVHYPSSDGKWTISAFVYVPNNIQRNGKFPAIVYVHGGPTGQTVNSFSRFIQYIVNQGYLVIAPNFRGSTGYGKEFMKANYRDEGGGDLHDVIDAAEWIEKSGFVDPKKLVVMGGSYGGYMTMMALTKSPDVWAAGVSIVPYVNWFTELATEDPLIREYDISIMGDPVENKALYEDRSPINFINRIKAPVLLLAGGNDPRDPATETQQMADAIKKQGGVVQLKIYKDEGHSFSKIENQIDAYQRVSDFLKVHVPSPGCGCSIYE